jgi:UDP-N-acetylmuramoyl-L-alanyl-D-glutamate--2,6-diaminopimelate ligase
MAAACAPAAMLIITDQHPRDEDPASIRSDLVSAAAAANISHIEVADPADAISHAISIANSSDAVLWCGPGHLKYREIAGKKVAFDAVKTAREAQL